jgi:Rrf2 family nitric oxide-sensitive transcriptional repressor
MRLARAAKDITVGEVVRRTEEGFQLADCAGCALSPACGLTGVLQKGVQAMLAVFDSYTIADLLTDKATMLRMASGESPIGIGA